MWRLLFDYIGRWRKIYTFFHDDNSFYTESNSIDEYAKMIISESIEENWGNPKFAANDMRIKVEKSDKNEPLHSNKKKSMTVINKKWWQFWK